MSFAEQVAELLTHGSIFPKVAAEEMSQAEREQEEEEDRSQLRRQLGMLAAGAGLAGVGAGAYYGLPEVWNEADRPVEKEEEKVTVPGVASRVLKSIVSAKVNPEEGTAGWMPGMEVPAGALTYAAGSRGAQQTIHPALRNLFPGLADSRADAGSMQKQLQTIIEQEGKDVRANLRAPERSQSGALAKLFGRTDDPQLGALTRMLRMENSDGKESLKATDRARGLSEALSDRITPKGDSFFERLNNQVKGVPIHERSNKLRTQGSTSELLDSLQAEARNVRAASAAAKGKTLRPAKGLGARWSKTPGGVMETLRADLKQMSKVDSAENIFEEMISDARKQGVRLTPQSTLQMRADAFKQQGIDIGTNAKVQSMLPNREQSRALRRNLARQISGTDDIADVERGFRDYSTTPRKGDRIRGITRAALPTLAGLGVSAYNTLNSSPISETTNPDLVAATEAAAAGSSATAATEASVPSPTADAATPSKSNAIQEAGYKSKQGVTPTATKTTPKVTSK